MQAAKFVNGFLDAWNHYDANGVASYLSNQGFYFDRLYDEKYSRPALTRYLYELFEREKQQYMLDGDILVGKSTIAYKYRALDLNSPGSKPAEYGAEFLSLSGDKITNIEVFYSTNPDEGFNPHPSPNDAIAGKYEKSGLGPHQAESHKVRLLGLMEVDKLFLSSELTLPMLAKAMNCTVNHLSQVINGNLSTSFYDLINSYRIAEAKKLLLEEAGGRSFVLNISNQVGFNSNSAFYTAFRKDCQLTPLQYRRSKLDH
jgi:AraC-like DNA-binding protein